MQYVELVRQKYVDDAEALTLAAQVAHQNARADLSAEILREACYASGFNDESLIQQAVVAFTSTGRLFDAIELLRLSVDANPDGWIARRLLFDLLMGVEDRVSGLKHGQYLVRNRRFDAELLLTLSDTVRRSNDPAPLQQMVDRNPDDQRPLIGQARVLFDDAKYDEAIVLLSRITRQHGDFGQAVAMHMHALAQAERFDELKQQYPAVSVAARRYPRYWMAIGQLLEAEGIPLNAARAYWQAIQLDPDWLLAWNELISALQSVVAKNINVESTGEWKVARDQATEVASILGQFNQARSRFIRTGGASRELAVQMAGVLEKLGRLWEAEAWTAIAFSLPEDDSVNVEKVRQSIVGRMRPDMPWYWNSPWKKQYSINPEKSTKIAESGHWSNKLNGIPLPVLNATITNNLDGNTSLEMPSDQVQPTESINLVNEAEYRNLQFFGRTSDSLDKPGIMLHHTLGCGGGALDFDLDGWPDLYLAAAGGKPGQQNSADNALMRNQAGSFVNATVNAGASHFGFGQGIVCGDLNEDGFTDIVVLNYGADAVFLNQGDGTFEDVTAQWLGLNNPPNWSTSGAVADIDLDGIADLVVAKYCAGMEPATVSCPIKETGEVRSCTPVLFNAEPDVFFKGTPYGGFDNVTQFWNAVPATPGRGLGVVVGCFDTEPGIEILVANDMSANHFWKLQSNDSEVTLLESALPRGLAYDRESRAQGSMGIATGDFDLDGKFDFYVSNFDNEYNSLSLQRVEGTWEDATSLVGLVEPTMPMVGFGTQAIDFNNDQELELIVTNGHVDLFNRGKERSVYAQPVQFFARTPAGGFREVSTSQDDQSYLSQPHVGRALFFLDADGDGQRDVVVTHQTEPVALLMNRTALQNQSMELKLVGTVGSRDAVGAVVRFSSEKRTQVRHLISGDGYLCTNEKSLHFAINKEATQLSIEVQWSDGLVEKFAGEGTSGEWLVVQGTGERVLLPHSKTETTE